MKLHPSSSPFEYLFKECNFLFQRGIQADWEVDNIISLRNFLISYSLFFIFDFSDKLNS